MSKKINTVDWAGWVLVGIGACGYIVLGWVKHYFLRTYAFDLGVYVQAMWQYAHFKWPVSTIGDEVALLGNHFGPILVFIAPLFRLFPYGYTLLLVQAVWVAISVLPIYWWTKKHFSDRVLPVTMGMIYLLHPGIQAALNFDFHLTTLATTFLAFVLYYGLEKKWKLYWLWFGLSLLVKEDLLLVLAMFGVYLWFGGDKKQGVMTTAVALGWFVVLLMWVMPAINPRKDVLHSADRFVRVYLGDRSLFKVIAEPVASPMSFWGKFVDFEVKRRSQLVAALPFGFLPVLSPLGWLLGAPIWYSRYQSSIVNLWAPVYQYGATTAPIFAFATIQVLARLKRTWLRWVEPLRFSVYASAWMVAGYLLVPLWYKQPVGQLFTADFYADRLGARDEIMREIALIPANASVLADGMIVPHLATRDQIYMYFPGKLYRSDYVVLLKQRYILVEADIVYFREHGYEVVHDSSVVFVAKRRV